MNESETPVHKPAPRRISYRITRALCSLKEWMSRGSSLQLEALEEMARGDVGNREFADPSFREPLSILLRSLKETAQLNSLGRLVATNCLRQVLVNRLSLERAWGGPPTFSNSSSPKLVRPVYVLGLPRTGTTLLLNLLAADGNARHLRYWESLTPIMAAGVKREADSPTVRQKLAVHQVNRTNALAPGLASIHKIEPLGPEECLWLLQNTLLSYSFPLMWKIPEYSEWLDERSEAEWESAYAYYLATLKLIQGETTARHWVLKCPLHTPRLATIARLVPDACFIQTYRNAGEVVASMCSLAHETQRISSDHTDPASIGQNTMRTLGRWANEGAQASAQFSDRVLDIHYKRLVTQPLETMRLIYDRFQLPWTPEGEAGMRDWLAANPQRKHGNHKYSLSDFGLTSADVVKNCESYHGAEQQLSKLV